MEKVLLNGFEDCMGHIVEYLTPNELTKLCLTSKQFKAMFSINLQWRKHCYSKWEIKKEIFCNQRLFDGMILYPFSWSICNSLNLPEDSSLLRDSTNHLKIEFNGLVGENNRSVQTFQSFPPLSKPITNINIFISFARFICGCSKLLSKQKKSSVQPSNHNHNHNTNEQDGEHNNTDEDEDDEKEYPRFFSTPYYDSVLKTHNIELRQVAYFEVKITSTTVHALSEEDCIAVGLSKEHFSLVKVMPGWDYESYGYHSDDGGIFHGKGTQLCTYGPKFGLDDIVGCGLRYDTNEIFYTLNGTYLGVAFENVSGKLFPTVGIDAKVTIHFNFGLEAFQFSLHNLAKYF